MTVQYSSKCPECDEIVTIEFETIPYLGQKGGMNNVYRAKCSKCGHKAEVCGVSKIRAKDGFAYKMDLNVIA